MSKHYKYLHLLLQNEYKFVSSMIQLLTSHDSLRPDEHLFITRFPRVYEQISEFPNTKLDENGFRSLLSIYGGDADWIFVHALNFSPCRVAFDYPQKYAKKTIWRTWGHDVYMPSLTGGNTLKLLARKVVFRAYVQKIRHFRMIGIANACDQVMCEKMFGSVSTGLIPYTWIPGRGKMLESALEYGTKQIKHDTRVMVGHSGYTSDNQLEVLGRLSVYAKQPMIVSLMLPYGDADYIERVKTEARRLFGEKVEVFDHMRPYDEYLKFLSTVDIAIMDQLHSAALGTISPLLYLGKKIFLNRRGIIKEGFLRENVPFEYTDQIGVMPFSEFCSPICDADRERFSALAANTDDDFPAKMWEHLLSELTPKNS